MRGMVVGEGGRSSGVLLYILYSSLVDIPLGSLYTKSYAMSGPEKMRSRGLWIHIVSYNIGYCCISCEMTGYCTFQCKTSLKRDLRCTYRCKYIERTYWKTQSVVLGGNPHRHRFFVRLVALIFRLTVGTFGCLAPVGFLAYF